MKHKSSTARWLVLTKGAVQKAEYKEPELPKFAGNPHILALPLIKTREEVMRSLQRCPDYNEKMRQLKPHLRTHAVMDLLHFFQPLPIHLKLEGMISRMLRDGYLSRNPVDPEYIGRLKERLEHFEKKKSLKQEHVLTASGFSMAGVSGMGKSTGIREVLQTYPQIIIHSEFQGHKVSNHQVVWLKLECPKSGASIKALCLSFIEALDSLLDTKYTEDFGRKASNTEQLVIYMAILASKHGLGMLVIDEIQNINAATSGGAAEMLNFFVDLVNTIGIPILLIGTYLALPILTESFRQARRGSGQGDLIWDRMLFDEEWHLFLETLWDMQYVGKICPLTPELSYALYDVSYGIIDLAIRIYMAAQWRAIETCHEEITEDMIRSAYRDDFRLVSRILETLKSGNIAEIHGIEDLLPPTPIPILQSSSKQVVVSKNTVNETAPPAVGVQAAQVQSATKASTTAPSSAAPSMSIDRRVLPFRIVRKRVPRRHDGLKLEEGDLRAIVTLGAAADPPLNAYQALLQQGHIRSSDEFL